ncbi:hypothetical protein MKX08_004437 [Trichoderma sp. CBMAI-0020]|nr:hypothetical protein MKX08_004437 [Trichoderma sp. CBMAI-0020]
MASTKYDFKCAVITGGAGGIGKGLAIEFIKRGKKVILVGRTRSKLEATSKEIGAAAYYVLDTGKVQDIAPFITRVLSDHPDVDCLVNNAGVQRPLDMVNDDPATLLAKADEEININVHGPLHLAVGFLPHFKKSNGTPAIINVSSIVGYNPFLTINPVYNGTKAWVHFWTMNLRTQLHQNGYTNIGVVEIVPPTVATDLHRERADPDDNKKHKNKSALSIEEFLSEVNLGLDSGKDTIGAGAAQDLVERWYSAYGDEYDEKTARG